MRAIYLDDLLSSDRFVHSVALGQPFLCRNAPVRFEYKAAVLAALQSNAAHVDISCCNEGESFCGNPIYREKVDMKISDFTAAWVACANEQAHWALELDLQLYLSQCCFACPKEPTTCDIDPSSISIPLPYILCDPRLSSNQSNLWMNIQSARSTLHYDASHNLLLLLAGRKEVTLLSPSCTSYLEPVPASDANPNHSALSFEEVEGWVRDRASGADARAQCLVQKVVMHAGDALFIPEGWWHQVKSDQCSMALNFWFSYSSENPCAAGGEDPAQLDAVPAAAAGNAGDMRPYKLRKLVHEMVRDELASLSAASLKGASSESEGSFQYGSALTYDAFSAALLSLVSCSTGRSGAGSVDATSSCGNMRGCSNGGRRAAETVMMLSSDSSLPETSHAPGPAPAPKQGWLAFAAASVLDQRRLWLPFARQHPSEWTRALLSLPPQAAARLLDYWDTLVPTDFVHVPTDAAGAGLQMASGSAAATEQTGVPSESTHPVNRLDKFFMGIFEPCGDRVPEVRRRLIEQKNVHNQEVARQLLGSILGLPL